VGVNGIGMKIQVREHAVVMDIYVVHYTLTLINTRHQ
jgi:hypothetical protein